MIQKKICMLGGFAVGKTSLVARYVSSIFSDKYLSTVGVKIDKKQLNVDGKDVTMMLWDIYGQDDFQTVQPSQLANETFSPSPAGAAGAGCAAGAGAGAGS